MKIRLLFVLIIAYASFACSGGNTKPQTVVRPVNVYKVESLGYVDRNFVGVVTAENYTNLAFTVSGQLIRLNVDNGQKVSKGDVIAVIDPRDFQLQVDLSKAELQTSQSQLSRNERLYAKQAVSKQDYEIAETNYARAKAAYDNARYKLNDTRLLAPFNGIIETKFVENFQTVSVGQSIVKLVDPKIINVQFILPENSIEIMNMKDKTFKVEFDNYKGQFFTAELKEYVEASADGSGVPVTLKITDPAFSVAKYKNVSPGFSCLVKLDINNPGYETVCAVPVTAVFTPAGTQDQCVWVVKDSKVEARKVRIGELFGTDMVIIETGLIPGEEVVVAGVYQIVDGQQVTVLNK